MSVHVCILVDRPNVTPVCVSVHVCIQVDHSTFNSCVCLCVYTGGPFHFLAPIDGPKASASFLCQIFALVFMDLLRGHTRIQCLIEGMGLHSLEAPCLPQRLLSVSVTHMQLKSRLGVGLGG